jgi:hypothetical protein
MSQIDPKQAVDLDAVKVRQQNEDLAKEAAEKQRQEAIEKMAAAWEKSMKRTFKGIFHPATRRRWLRDS